jgi:predicted nuclease of predicted toxin-antitoxin system
MGSAACPIPATPVGEPVKFLIDAQLPRRMRCWFSDAGFDALHTLELPTGNRSTDEQIRRFARSDQRVLISKDADFVDSHLLTGQPENCF